MNTDVARDIEQVKQFAKTWNPLYAAEEFEKVKALATEDVGIANAAQSTSATCSGSA